jgi:hypothetical protein
MVHEKISRTIRALENVGLTAIRGFPGMKAENIREPRLAVQLERYDRDSLVLAIDIFTLGEAGGTNCEDIALLVDVALKQEMAVCTIGDCKFLGQPGWFTIRVLAQWRRELDYSVYIEGTAIPYLISCNATMHTVQVPYIDSATGETLDTVTQKRWEIELTDLWPRQQMMKPERSDMFELVVGRALSQEKYPRCVWREVRLEEIPEGILRTRIAQTYGERKIENA